MQSTPINESKMNWNKANKEKWQHQYDYGYPEKLADAILRWLAWRQNAAELRQAKKIKRMLLNLRYNREFRLTD